ncbi:hypothetical protein CYB_0621 [Synechococcus sp. JA-2-3B'a(2-13)]|nr:hypothetical protein CYB_0621 [Synechococcus sp. JA-2-3B'a(2-13)]
MGLKRPAKPSEKDLHPLPEKVTAAHLRGSPPNLKWENRDLCLCVWIPPSTACRAECDRICSP